MEGRRRRAHKRVECLSLSGLYLYTSHIKRCLADRIAVAAVSGLVNYCIKIFMDRLRMSHFLA